MLHLRAEARNRFHGVTVRESRKGQVQRNNVESAGAADESEPQVPFAEGTSEPSR